MENKIPYKDVNDLFIPPSQQDNEIVNISGFNLTSLKGIEKFKNLKELHCQRNYLTSLKELETCINLTYINSSENNIIDLEGIESLPNLLNISFSKNPVYHKYFKDDNNTINGINTIKELQEQIFIDIHLNKESNLRGLATTIDTNLF